jgi:hypothetical protein
MGLMPHVQGSSEGALRRDGPRQLPGRWVGGGGRRVVAISALGGPRGGRWLRGCACGLNCAAVWRERTGGGCVGAAAALLLRSQEKRVLERAFMLQVATSVFSLRLRTHGWS